MTAADLLTDPEFLAFCSIWERDGRCPLVFADWLRERCGDGQAGGAEWAATEPDCDIFGGRGAAGGPQPWAATDNRFWWWRGNPDRTDNRFWWWRGNKDRVGRDWADQVPPDVFGRMERTRDDEPNGRSAGTFPGAVALLLDAWALARVPATA